MPERISVAELEGLLPYCLGDQEAKLQAVIEQGSIRGAARSLKLNDRTVERVLETVRRRAALQGHIPGLGIYHQSPGNVPLSGLSIFHKETESSPAHWAKYKVDDRLREAVFNAMAEAVAADLPRLSPIPAPKINAPDLLNLITLTDTHVGMYAWARESGHAWDLDIAERTLVSASLAMMDAAPKADTCFIAELGDWNHYDGHVAKTPSHAHPLDAAGRPGEMIETSVRILRRIVDAALKRHKKVVLLVAQGNHDLQSYKWLRVTMAAAYEREKRLEIIHQESAFYAYLFGLNMLGFHHGHTAKKESLPEIFADLFSEMWGMAEFREAHCGHLHHKIMDRRGMTVCQHDTLSPNDAHSASLGFKARRRAEIITYHRDFGRISEHYITAKMLEAKRRIKEAA